MFQNPIRYLTQIPIPFPSEEEVARLLALPTPPPSPLTPLSSPLPQIPPPPTSPTYAQATLSCREAMRATPSLIPSPQVCLPPSPLPPMSSLLPPFFLPSPIRPPHTRVAMAQMRVAAPSSHHSLLPSHTPPLLPIPLPAPSTSHRANIPEADMPPRKRLLLTTLYLDTSIRSTERTNMAAIEVVNLRDAHDDRVAVRAEIEILRKEMLAYERQSSETHHALARFESQNRALEARIAVIETQAYRHEWQRQDADDHATRAIMRIQELEAGARVDTLEETGSSS
ncbi:hypothetical protein Tco_0958754 [Tanacetum coccineum]